MGCKCSKRGCVICDNRKKRKRAVLNAKRSGATVPYDMRTLIEDGWSPDTIRAVLRRTRADANQAADVLAEIVRGEP